MTSIKKRLAILQGDPLFTEYAPAGRSTDAEILQQAELVRQHVPGLEMLDSVQDALFLLNANRQVVYANAAGSALLALNDPDGVLGSRPGEILDCDRAFVNPGGCGTTLACSTCGASQALLVGLEGRESSEEVRITQKVTGDALDLRVWGKPVSVAGETYVLLTMRDNRDQKRRRALERIFFHDILNTAGAMEGCLELLREPGLSSEALEDVVQIAPKLARQLVEEIRSFQMLSGAERNSLAVEPEEIGTLPLLNDILESYRYHEAAAERVLALEPSAVSLTIETDRGILTRVLGNLVKNALEASAPQQTVRVGVSSEADTVTFHVHSSLVMPEEVRLQIFRRSFSTKGAGRGLGTYSVKLLTEKYLQGQVSFRSVEEEGTTFFVTIPIRWAGVSRESSPAIKGPAIKGPAIEAPAIEATGARR